jgi:type I restriction enzyme, S subunit
MEVRSGYKRTDVGLIPQDWDVSSVGTMGDVRAGKALAVRALGQQRPYLRTKNVFDGRIDLADVLCMPMTEGEFSRYRLRHGDVLLNEGQSLELVGRCAMYKDEYPEPCAIQNQLVRFRARDGVSASFAAHLFRYCQTSGVFRSIALQTTSVAHLGVSRFHRLQLAWPPKLIEQDRIAEALSDADTLIESLEQLIVKKRRLKHGAMQELLTGKRRLHPFSEEWESIRLGDLFAFKNGLNKEKEFFGHGTPIVNYMDVFQHPAIYSSMLTGRVSLTNQELSTFDVRMGDVFFTRTSETTDEVGIASVVLDEPSQTVFSGFLLRARPKNNKLCNEFKRYCFAPSYVRKQIISRASYTTRALTNGRILSAVTLRIPESEEQLAIAEVLNDLDAEIAAVEVKLGKAHQLKQGMMQELLTGKVRLV